MKKVLSENELKKVKDAQDYFIPKNDNYPRWAFIRANSKENRELLKNEIGKMFMMDVEASWGMPGSQYPNIKDLYDIPSDDPGYDYNEKPWITIIIDFNFKTNKKGDKITEYEGLTLVPEYHAMSDEDYNIYYKEKKFESKYAIKEFDDLNEFINYIKYWYDMPNEKSIKIQKEAFPRCGNLFNAIMTAQSYDNYMKEHNYE